MFLQEAQTTARIAMLLGAEYLVRHFDALFDPFDVCIVTYALYMANHRSKGDAFQKMDKMKRTGDIICRQSILQAHISDVFIESSIDL